MQNLKKRLNASILLFCFVHLPFSCSVDCGPFELLESTITVINATIGSAKEGSFQQNTSSIYSEAAVRVFISDMEYSELALQNIGLINSAMACSPPKPEPTQKISKVEISSSKAIYIQDKTYEAIQM